METIGRTVMTELSQSRALPSVSIYLPTFRAGRDVEQNPIRFKNLFRQVKSQLHGGAYRRLPGTTAVLDQLKGLLEDRWFWRHQSDGLAVFAQPGRVRYFRLPITFPELAVVAGRFHLKPLMRLLLSDGIFFVLTLSRGGVALFQGSAEFVQKVELEGLPELPEERVDTESKEVSFHTRAPAHGEQRDARFYSAGRREPLVRETYGPFLKRVDRVVREQLEDGGAPLVLVGFEHLIPVYREVNTYPHLLDQSVPINPAGLDDTELHRRAWEIIEPHFRQEVKNAVERYELLRGKASALASENLETIIAGAYHARVDTLFVPVGVQLWGEFDLENNEPTFRPKPRPGDEDLLDFAAVHTLLNRGDVFALAPDSIPGAGPVAAIFRF